MSDTRSQTKYGERIAGHDWSEPGEGGGGQPRTRVKGHEIEVLYDTEPEPADNYSRERYTLHVKYDDSGEPYVLYAVEHRWKGNYWRDVTDWDFRDVPEPVRRRVAAVLPVDGPDALETAERLMDPGGESRWKKHHKPRVEGLDGDEMWGLSYLKEALQSLDRAADAFEDGTTGAACAEKIAATLRKVIVRVDGRGATDA